MEKEENFQIGSGKNDFLEFIHFNFLFNTSEFYTLVIWSFKYIYFSTSEAVVGIVGQLQSEA